jgi:hypothetical protein
MVVTSRTAPRKNCLHRGVQRDAIVCPRGGDVLTGEFGHAAQGDAQRSAGLAKLQQSALINSVDLNSPGLEQFLR